MKIFLYLFPIKEFTEMFLLDDYSHVNKILAVLNSTINKRYRKKGYQIVFALYPDKELYGVEKDENDKVIYTDITFEEASGYDENRNLKENFTPKLPSEEYILEQLGIIDTLVVGGYHAMSCVRRVAEVALNKGIDTLVDLDLTDLFFNVYENKELFDEESYDIYRFKKNLLSKPDVDFKYEEKTFDKNFNSPVYGYKMNGNK